MTVDTGMTMDVGQVRLSLLSGHAEAFITSSPIYKTEPYYKGFYFCELTSSWFLFFLYYLSVVKFSTWSNLDGKETGKEI